MRVAQRAAVIAGLAVADMIVGVDDEARGLKLAYHVQIAAGMLTKAVDELQHSARLAERGIGPRLDGISAVCRGEADLSDGHVNSSLLFMMLPVAPQAGAIYIHHKR